MDKFYFSVDFVVLETKHVPNSHKLILVIHGQLFSATTNACINCRTGVMSLSFGNMKAKLNIFNVEDQPQMGWNFFLDTVEESDEDIPPI